MRTFDRFGVSKFAQYSNFYVGNEASKYKLHISGFTGDATDEMKYHNGMMFSTKDRDNDENDGGRKISKISNTRNVDVI